MSVSHTFELAHRKYQLTALQAFAGLAEVELEVEGVVLGAIARITDLETEINTNAGSTISRKTHHALRPLLPETLTQQISLEIQQLSDPIETPIDDLVVTLSGAALALTGIQLESELGCVRVACINNHFVINPKNSPIETTLSLVVASSRNGILMAEGTAAQQPDDIIQDAIAFGHLHNQSIIQAIHTFRNKTQVGAGKPVTQPDNRPIAYRLYDEARHQLDLALDQPLSSRADAVAQVKQAARHTIVPHSGDIVGHTQFETMFNQLLAYVLRHRLISGETRLDGRNAFEVRRLFMQNNQAKAASIKGLLETAVSVALVDESITSVSTGIIEEDIKSVLLTDLTRLETTLCSLAVNVTGTKQGVLAVKLAARHAEISIEQLSDALTRAREARLTILSGPKPLSEHKALSNKHDKESLMNLNDLDIDTSYVGTVVDHAETGLEIEIMPSCIGLLPTSELRHIYAENHTPTLQPGQTVRVKIAFRNELNSILLALDRDNDTHNINTPAHVA